MGREIPCWGVKRWQENRDFPYWIDGTVYERSKGDVQGKEGRVGGGSINKGAKRRMKGGRLENNLRILEETGEVSSTL